MCPKWFQMDSHQSRWERWFKFFFWKEWNWDLSVNIIKKIGGNLWNYHLPWFNQDNEITNLIRSFTKTLLRGCRKPLRREPAVGFFQSLVHRILSVYILKNSGGEQSATMSEEPPRKSRGCWWLSQCRPRINVQISEASNLWSTGIQKMKSVWISESW